MNYHDPYSLAVFGFIDITDITFVHVENDEYGEQKLAESIAHARIKIAELTAV